MIAATGSATLIALGRELEFGVPGGGILGYRSILPVKADLMGEKSESGAVNQSGFIEPAVAGKKGGKFEWSIPMSVAAMLEYLEHVCRSVQKTVLEAGPPAVYRYRFSPSITGVDTSFYSLVSKPPVERWWLYGIKFGEISLEVGDNEEIPLKLKGDLAHGTRLGAAVPDPANTGTYTLGPFVRGPLKNRAGGPVFVKVTQVAPVLQLKVEQTAGAPAFVGAAVTVALDPVSGRAVWQNLQGATGLDLGFWDADGNKDPLEIIFPGTAAEHAGLGVDDVFKFPVDWPDPAVPFLSGYQAAFTSAHWEVRLRHAGAADWLVKDVNTGSLTLAWPVTPDSGARSRYPFAITRDGRFMPSVELNRKLVDDFFIDAGERRARFEAELSFKGRQIGTGVHREGLTATFPALRVDEDTREPANEKAVQEKVKLTGERDDDGSAPVTIDIITTRNWTPTL
jgi:hypothetical protein